MYRSALARVLAAILAGLVIAFSAAAQEVAVIELKHRFADDVVAVIGPLVEPGGSLTGIDNMLLVRVSAANLAQIRRAVAAIDRAPRQLVITVGQGTATRGRAADVRGGITVRGDDIHVGVNRPPGAPAGAEVMVGAGSQVANLSNLSSVRTLEGSETLISIGTATPRVAAATGFYATPRVQGDHVTLEISPRQERLRPGKRGSIVESRGADTIVSGRLGEWIQVGAVQDSASGATAGILVWGRHTEGSEYSAWVKVEEVPGP
mgnify:CR=1 FL=1